VSFSSWRGSVPLLLAAALPDLLSPLEFARRASLFSGSLAASSTGRCEVLRAGVLPLCLGLPLRPFLPVGQARLPRGDLGETAALGNWPSWMAAFCRCPGGTSFLLQSLLCSSSGRARGFRSWSDCSFLRDGPEGLHTCFLLGSPCAQPALPCASPAMEGSASFLGVASSRRDIRLRAPSTSSWRASGRRALVAGGTLRCFPGWPSLPHLVGRSSPPSLLEEKSHERMLMGSLSRSRHRCCWLCGPLPVFQAQSLRSGLQDPRPVPFLFLLVRAGVVKRGLPASCLGLQASVGGRKPDQTAASQRTRGTQPGEFLTSDVGTPPAFPGVCSFPFPSLCVWSAWLPVDAGCCHRRGHHPATFSEGVHHSLQSA
jgi:hypothetical protein